MARKDASADGAGFLLAVAAAVLAWLAAFYAVAGLLWLMGII